MNTELLKSPISLARKSRIRTALVLLMKSTSVIVSLYLAPSPAYAIYCSNCSTFYQQMFEYAEAVNTALNTAEQLQTQIQQYQNMVTQGTGLPSTMFGSIAADLKNVANIYTRSQSIGLPDPEYGLSVQHRFPRLRVLPESSSELIGSSCAGSISEVVGTRPRQHKDGT